MKVHDIDIKIYTHPHIITDFDTPTRREKKMRWLITEL